MPRLSKRHHTVSRFYLDYFANDAGQVTTVETPSGRTYTQNVANASVQSGFYTAIDHTGDPTDMVEQMFGTLEGLAAEAWRRVADGTWPLAEGHRTAMAGWIALQLLRGPNVRAAMRDLVASHVTLTAVLGGRALVREALQRSRNLADDATVNQAWIESFTNPVRIDVSSNEHLRYVGQLLPEVMDHLLGRIWYLSVYTRKGLATCDHPVYVVPNPEYTEAGLGTGIYNAREFHLPLTRRHSLSMALAESLPPEMAALGDVAQPGVGQTALYTNSCMTFSARRVLFHHPDDTPVNGLELHPTRPHEIELATDLWSWMKPEDRQVLIDAGLTPPHRTPGPALDGPPRGCSEAALTRLPHASPDGSAHREAST